MNHLNPTDRHRVLGWIMLAGGALMILFWTLYLSGAMDLGQHDPVIAAFESAFILADTALGIFLCAAGWSLLRGGSRGPFLMVVAASMSLYLGLLDLAFYGQAGLYGSLTVASAFEMSLNALCIVGGALCLRYGSRLLTRDRSVTIRDPEILPLRRADVGFRHGRRIGGAA